MSLTSFFESPFYRLNYYAATASSVVLVILLESVFCCRYCKAQHHYLLCFKARGSSGKANLGDSVKQDGTSANSKAANASAVESNSSNVATAVVMIEDDQGTRYPARTLHTMKVAVKRTDISIMSIGQTRTKESRKIKAVVKC